MWVKGGGVIFTWVLYGEWGGTVVHKTSWSLSSVAMAQPDCTEPFSTDNKLPKLVPANGVQCYLERAGPWLRHSAFAILRHKGKNSAFAILHSAFATRGKTSPSLLLCHS